MHCFLTNRRTKVWPHFWGRCEVDLTEVTWGILVSLELKGVRIPYGMALYIEPLSIGLSAILHRVIAHKYCQLGGRDRFCMGSPIVWITLT